MPDPTNAPVTGPVSIPPGTPHVAAASRRGRPRFLDALLLARRRRREQIRQFETATGRTLLCYVSQAQSIAYPDVYQMHRLLEGIEPGTPITLLLNSPGGEIDAAEKLVHRLREICLDSPGALEVVVPDYAKSAATLMALGADRIVMSDSSELGPIDPQIELPNGRSVPIFAYLRAYDEAERRSTAHPMNPTFGEAFSKFDPVLMAVMRQIVSRARTCAENLLKRRGVNYTAVVEALMDIDRFPSHGQMIDSRTAKDIGLAQVHHQDLRSESWRRYWRLYRELAAVSGNDRRVFESRRLSLIA